MPDRFLTQILRDVAVSARDFDAHVFGKISDLQMRRISWDVRVVRPDDLLVLTFTFFNFRREGDQLRRAAEGPAYLVVEHQAQSLADAAYPSIADQASYANDTHLDGREPPNGAPPPPPGPVPAKAPIPPVVPIRASGPSRIAHLMPADVDGIPFTLDGLLEASRTWPLHLDAAAKPDAAEWHPGLIDWVVRDLDKVRVTLREGVADLLSAAQFTQLDRLARSLADSTIASVNAPSRPGIVPREIEAETSRAVEDVLGARGTTDAKNAANLYLRAVSGSLVMGSVSRTEMEIGKIAELIPGFYGVLMLPHEPAANETAIEMPWRLIGSPLEGASFTHALKPVTHGNRTELWHSRLGHRRTAEGDVEVDDRATEKLRYLWSPDYKKPFSRTTLDPTFSLDGLDRQMIVKLTAGYTEKRPNGSAFTPRPVFARRLMLSALGGLLESDRRWTLRPNDVDLMAWTHRASQGRDSYVRVEYAGFLYPFGHAATLVKISERTFEWRDEANRRRRIAVLRQRFFIIVREKTRSYPRGAPQPFEGRSMPFEAIECGVTTTPDLATPGSVSTYRLADDFYATSDEWRRAFWPSRGSQGIYQFPLVGIDAAGRRIPFSMPLLFVSEVYNRSAKLPAIQNHYNGIGPNAASSNRRNPDLRGATVRLAEPDGSEAADVDYPARNMLFRAVDPTTGVSGTQQPELQQQPIVEKANVQLASVERLTGQVKTPAVIFDQTYLTNGFPATPSGELFMRIEGSDPLDFGGGGATSDTVGGLATPSMVPAGLSRRHGVASAGPAGLGGFSGGDFNPADYFPSAKLLGFFDLKDILKAVPLGAESPVITTNEFPDRFETRFRLVQDIPKKDVLGLMTGEGARRSWT